MLLAAMRDHSQHPEAEADSAPLSTALVVAALQSNNPKLHSMVVIYLENVGTEHAMDLISVLLKSAESDPSLDRFEYDIDGVAGNSSEVSCPCVSLQPVSSDKREYHFCTIVSAVQMTCVNLQCSLLLPVPRLDGTAEALTGTSTTQTMTSWPATTHE